MDIPLTEALKHWRKLIDHGPPRPIEFRVDKLADAVLFTDGSTPDPRSGQSDSDRIGAVLFDRRCLHVFQFTSIVRRSVKKMWLTVKTQTVPIKMLAPVIALFTFHDRFNSSDDLIFIDSEAVEGSLIQ